MDLERIKQNLRLRSGRTKKLKKTQKPPPQASQPIQQLQNGTPKHESKPVETESAAADDEVKEEDKQEQKESGSQQDSEEKQEQELEKKSEATSPKPTTREKESSEDGPNPKKTAVGVEPEPEPEDSHDEEPLTQDEETSRHRAEGGDMTPRTSDQKTSDPYDMDTNKSAEALSFDLQPPSRTRKANPMSIETMSELLFSAGHLNILLHQPSLLTKFTAFLQRYRPNDVPLLIRYIETSKAIAAIDYANAIAENIPNDSNEPEPAATFNDTFKASCTTIFKALVDTALPMYITYNLVKVSTEYLTDEITGRSTSMTRNLVEGLSEVFCLTDPRQEDNPIIYASEEFYRLTGYDRDDVIGHNCRFLQGPRTKRDSPARLRECIDNGEETYETLLNYRRDGRPFVNVLMIAPLHDDKGNVKYHIGAQLNVSGLIESGSALESFQRYLHKRKLDQRREEYESSRHATNTEARRKAKALAKLRDLSELFDLEESAVVQSNSRSSSMERDDDTRSLGSGNPRTPRTPRKVLVDSDQSDEEDEDDNNGADPKAWELGRSGPRGLSGKLPGIYEKYMLIRPSPSLRIIFASPKIRKFGQCLQSPFLSHVAAPQKTLKGLRESFDNGIPVSAKINFLAERGEKRDGTKTNARAPHEDGKYGKACWISATPLLGGDDRIGVWMVIFVEKSQVRAQTRESVDLQPSETRPATRQQRKNWPNRIEIPKRPVWEQKDVNQGDVPTKPVRVDTTEQQTKITPYRHVAAPPVDEYRSEDDELYEDVPSRHNSKRVQPPRTPPYIADEYVRPQRNRSKADSADRVFIDPDSDGEYEEHNSESQMLTPQAPNRGVMSPQSRSPPEASPELSPIDDPASPVTQESGMATRREPQPRDAQSNVDSNTTLHHNSQSVSPGPFSPVDEGFDDRDNEDGKSLPGYMDYLRHPGNNRQASGYYETRGRTRFKAGGDGDSASDPDCGRSPYSVD